MRGISAAVAGLRGLRLHLAGQGGAHASSDPHPHRTRVGPGGGAAGSPREDAGGVSVQIARDLPAITALEHQWNELERLTPEATGFQSFWWCKTWVLSTLSQEKPAPKPLVIVVRQDGEVVWLLPLQVERRFGIRWARGLGQPVTQYGDALAVVSPRRAAWRAAADDALRQLGAVDVVSMIQVRADGVLAKLPGGSLIRAASRSAPFLDLRDAAAVTESLAIHKTLRRRRRALERAGAVSVEAADHHEAIVAVRHALLLKRGWLRAKRRLHGSGLTTPVARHFLERLASNGHIEVCRLRVGTETAAIDVGFVAGEAYRSLLSAFDARYAHGSPGHALTRSLIERCRARGLGEFDVLAPAEPYKAAISSGEVDIVSVHKALTRRGRAGVLASLTLRRPFYAARRCKDDLGFAVRAPLAGMLDAMQAAAQRFRGRTAPPRSRPA